MVLFSPNRAELLSLTPVGLDGVRLAVRDVTDPALVRSNCDLAPSDVSLEEWHRYAGDVPLPADLCRTAE